MCVCVCVCGGGGGGANRVGVEGKDHLRHLQSSTTQ